VVVPRDASEVSAAIGEAERDGLPVKAVGAGHAFSDAAVTTGVLLRVDRLSRVRSIDARTGLVTVEAGMPLATLNDLLAEQGLTLGAAGDTQTPTIAGAIATGTHGTGRDAAALCARVRGLELVLANGMHVSCSAEHDSELFEAARLGLGALGVVTAVTLHAEPAYRLAAHEEPMRLGHVLSGFDELVMANEHASFSWFPYTDRAVTRRYSRLAAGEQPPGRRSLRGGELAAAGVSRATYRLTRAAPRLARAANHAVARAAANRAYTDRPDRMFTSTPRGRFVAAEYALPRSALAAALREVRQRVERADWCVNLPVDVRVAPADTVWLSTAHGRDTAYVGCRMVQGTAYREYFAAVEQIMTSYEGRPHWGMPHIADASYLASRYPRFNDFLAVRDRVDPGRRFANAYTRRVLGD
jgi:FAD-linked oxidoreductase